MKLPARRMKNGYAEATELLIGLELLCRQKPAKLRRRVEPLFEEAQSLISGRSGLRQVKSVLTLILDTIDDRSSPKLRKAEG